jgi:hypothetical protein
MKAWKNIPLKTRVSVLLVAGVGLIVFQVFFFNILILIAGMAALLIAFFSLAEAPAHPYTENQRLKLFYGPLIMAIIGAVAGYLLYSNFYLLISTAILAVGIYSMFIGEILLSFNGMKVYKGFYAYIAASIYCIIALFMTTLWLLDAYGSPAH